jgi:peptidoglycan DL-endopeptidase CwlO
VASGRNYRPAHTLLAVCTAAVSAVVLTPGSTQADPQPTLEEVRQRVAGLDHNAEVASESYNQAVEQVHDLEKRVDVFQATVQRQQARVTALQRNMGAFAAAQYRAGNVDQTMQLLLSADPERFLREMSSLNAISTRQAESLTQLQAEQAELAQDKLAAAQQLAELERTRSELARRKGEVEGNLQQAQRLLNSLTAEDRARLAAEERASREEARSQADDLGDGGDDGGNGGGGDDGDDGDDVLTYNGPASGRARSAIAYAYAQLGDPYQWGESGPSSFDCSGLTMAAWAQAGVSLPHNSGAQMGSGRRVSRSDLRPGDLVFFYSPVSHVGLYVGGGKMIHAPNSRSHVKVAPVDQMPFTGAVRP